MEKPHLKIKEEIGWAAQQEIWANTNTHREMPSLVQRSPDGRGYYIPQLCTDDGYSSMSNKSSPVKETLQLKKEWPESPTFGSQYGSPSPINLMLKSQYGFNAFISPVKESSKKSTTAQPTFGNHGFGAGDYTINAQMQMLNINTIEEVYARKVFVGGLPIDVKEADIFNVFRPFGKLVIDWPRRSEKEPTGTNTRTMSGYVFLVFESELSVQLLVQKCYKDQDKLFLLVSSPTMRNKPVQVRPWKLSDTEYILEKRMKIWSRRTVFVGGLPRPTRATDLAVAMERLYGKVAYVGIDIDPELKYPKGAARVVFVSSESLLAAINGKYVHLQHSDVQKRVEIKPYVVEERECDQCEGRRCAGRYAPYFCGVSACMQYYCETCWDMYHTYEDNTFDHKPLVRCGEQTKQLARPPHHIVARQSSSGYGLRQRFQYF